MSDPDLGPTSRALALFDRLPPVSAAGLHGCWRGAGHPTGHPLDGLLEACHWHGKRFDGPEQVQPLLFRSVRGGVVAVRPVGVRLAVALVARLPVLKCAAVGRLVQLCLPLLATRRSQARLRMIEVRGVVSATIVYDGVPIQDALRQLDADTLLGMMDLKGMAQPFFFVLQRDAST